MDADRIRKVVVSGEMLRDALHIPAGARVIGVTMADHGCIELLIAHDDFSQVAEGAAIPQATVEVTRHYEPNLASPVSYTSRWRDYA